MRYIRSRPWRSRTPWFTTRAGARRRGFRDDELLSVAHEVVLDDGMVMAAESEVMVPEDVVLPDAAAQPIPESMLAARVDISGLLAIASSETDRTPDGGEEPIVAFGWHTHASQSDGESPVSQRSA